MRYINSRFTCLLTYLLTHSQRKPITSCRCGVQATFGKFDRRRLVEWFEMQRLVGVRSIGVYSTPLAHADTHKTLSQYGRTPLVQHRTIGYLDSTGNGHFLMVNLAAINDCFYRHVYTHRFVAIIDFDEVITCPCICRITNSDQLTVCLSVYS